ncbi:MAG TPA: FHA domain-containing protein, partial [Gemmataceae bacterium]|nr:FHA domain-containing protein [Gemmataceae bacterium]
MSEPRIVLAGVGPKLSGLTWESSKGLRIGRESNLDVVLRDYSVDRLHAEVKHQGARWFLRDVAQNVAYPTTINGVPISKPHELAANDMLQFGRMQLRVSEIVSEAHLVRTPAKLAAAQSADKNAGMPKIMTSGIQMLVKAKTQQTWDKALEAVTNGAAGLHQDQAMLALVRANHHMTHISHLEELLQSILADTCGALNAQRGSIILADPQTGELTLKATLTASGRPGVPVRPFSHTLVKRCFSQGESLLCDDVAADESLVLARSIRHGAMASVICALLRTPRNRIGILHLDRGFLD